MNYTLIPRFMWLAFEKSFEKNMAILGTSDPKYIMKKAKKTYKTILGRIPEFGANDILLINILSGAQVAAVYLSLDNKPTVEQMTEYYDSVMAGSKVTTIFLKSTNYYSKKYQKKLASQAKKSQLTLNPYGWRFKFYPGQTLDSFDAIFDQCGICHLFRQLGMEHIIPAMCQYDYGMAKLTNTSFSRQYTLAEGGPVCDCHYKKKK